MDNVKSTKQITKNILWDNLRFTFFTHISAPYITSHIRRHAIFSHPYNQQRKWCVWNEKYCILSLTRVRPKHIVFHQTTCSNLNGMHTTYMYVLVTCQDNFLTCNPMFFSCCFLLCLAFSVRKLSKVLEISADNKMADKILWDLMVPWMLTSTK